jgi:ATP-dependent DNA helicase RecG
MKNTEHEINKLILQGENLTQELKNVRTYKNADQREEYIRQAGFEVIQQEQMVLQYINKHGRIKRADVISLCRLSKDQATRLLKRLVKESKINIHGEKRGAFYDFNP